MDYKKYNNYRIIRIYYPSSNKYNWNKNDSEREVNYLEQFPKVVVHEEDEYLIRQSSAELRIILLHVSNPACKYLNNEIIDLFWVVDLDKLFSNYYINVGTHYSKIVMKLESYFKRPITISADKMNTIFLRSIMIDEDTDRYYLSVEEFVRLIDKETKPKQLEVKNYMIKRG